ncbi:MAG: hypothetical protein KJ906_02500 [Nanoarchaeota archaeon]|nr:hypothetical protein [Nanoarchaeota archaeon]
MNDYLKKETNEDYDTLWDIEFFTMLNVKKIRNPKEFSDTVGKYLKNRKGEDFDDEYSKFADEHEDYIENISDFNEFIFDYINHTHLGEGEEAKDLLYEMILPDATDLIEKFPKKKSEIEQTVLNLLLGPQNMPIETKYVNFDNHKPEKNDKHD